MISPFTPSLHVFNRPRFKIQLCVTTEERRDQKAISIEIEHVRVLDDHARHQHVIASRAFHSASPPALSHYDATSADTAVVMSHRRFRDASVTSLPVSASTFASPTPRLRQLFRRDFTFCYASFHITLHILYGRHTLTLSCLPLSYTY